MLTVTGEPPPDNGGDGNATYRFAASRQRLAAADRRPERRSVRATPPREPEYVGSKIHEWLDSLSGYPAVHVPAWCGEITGSPTQMIVLAQHFYWAGQVRNKASSREGLPRAGLWADDHAWLAQSHAALAKDVGLTRRQVERAVEVLTSRRILIRADGRKLLAAERANFGDEVDDPGEAYALFDGLNVVCYRLSTHGIAGAFGHYFAERETAFLRECLSGTDKTDAEYRKLANSIARREQDPPVWPWKRVEQKLLVRESCRRKDGKADVSEYCRKRGEDYVPSPEDEFAGSQFDRLLRILGDHVTLPLWSLRLTKSPADALVFAKIYQYRNHLRFRHDGRLWLARTHRQLAEEIGLLNVTATGRKRYAAVSRSLKALQQAGLIEVVVARRGEGHSERVSLIRLLPMAMYRVPELVGDV